MHAAPSKNGRKHALTIQKTREPNVDIDKLIPTSTRSSWKRFRIPETGPIVGYLFVQQPKANTPDWVKLFEDHVPPSAFGESVSPGAAFLVPVEDHVFALTFGTGRFLLDPDAWEERFGLVTTLNMIAGGSVRSIDKQGLDKLQSHVREQASRNAHAREFGIDIEQDILRALTARPTDVDMFGERVTGATSLQISYPGKLDRIGDFLFEVHTKSKEKTYRKDFAWVDQLSPVTDGRTCDDLNARLVELINKNPDAVMMGAPEIIDWNQVAGFRFRAGTKSPQIYDLTIANLVDSFNGSPIDVKGVMTRRVASIKPSGDVYADWSAYKCLHAEVSKGQDLFVLSNGQWYKVAKDFVRSVNESITRIPVYEKLLPEFDDDREEEYIVRAAAMDPALAVMDQKFISIGGGSNKVELCDLYTDSRDLIHLKRKGASSTYSHLFNQGFVAAELFKTEPMFRQKANDLLPSSHRLFDSAVAPGADEYRVVFGVITHEPGALSFPFFSRVSLKHVASRLGAYGYRVALAKVAVKWSRAMRKKCPSRRAGS